MPYSPRVDDYVKWNHYNKTEEGWVYFVSDEYISIEVAVKDKPLCEYTKKEKHNIGFTQYTVLQEVYFIDNNFINFSFTNSIFVF